ncbi:hypothetical protein BGW42_002857 [Actinomortierella wolfii]|nr:hypothetical protein BGW42_002857 [Actinomortierella wolfii]
MSILSGPVAAPPVPDYAVSTTSRPSTMGQVRQRRQLIVLSNHPRPSIITTIDQGDTAEGEAGGNDGETEEDQEPLEEWIPKPFDPRAQPNLGLSLAPPASTSTRATAAPSAPPLPLATGVSEESRSESIHGTTDTVHDAFCDTLSIRATTLKH